MIDMLTILVVYLLVHTADTEILPNTRNIAIPQSVSVQKPRETTLVTVTRDMLYVNGQAVVSVADVGGSAQNVIEPCARRSPPSPRACCRAPRGVGRSR